MKICRRSIIQHHTVLALSGQMKRQARELDSEKDVVDVDVHFLGHTVDVKLSLFVWPIRKAEGRSPRDEKVLYSYSTV